MAWNQHKTQPRLDLDSLNSRDSELWSILICGGWWMVWNDDESSGDEIEGLNCSGDTKQLFFFSSCLQVKRTKITATVTMIQFQWSFMQCRLVCAMVIIYTCSLWEKYGKWPFALGNRVLQLRCQVPLLHMCHCSLVAFRIWSECQHTMVYTCKRSKTPWQLQHHPTNLRRLEAQLDVPLKEVITFLVSSNKNYLLRPI